MNGPLGSATNIVSIIGMNTTVEEIANYQDQDQEVAKNFPTSMEKQKQNILNQIIGARISECPRPKVDVTT